MPTPYQWLADIAIKTTENFAQNLHTKLSQLEIYPNVRKSFGVKDLLFFCLSNFIPFLDAMLWLLLLLSVPFPCAVLALALHIGTFANAPRARTRTCTYTQFSLCARTPRTPLLSDITMAILIFFSFFLFFFFLFFASV